MTDNKSEKPSDSAVVTKVFTGRLEIEFTSSPLPNAGPNFSVVQQRNSAADAGPNANPEIESFSWKDKAVKWMYSNVVNKVLYLSFLKEKDVEKHMDMLYRDFSVCFGYDISKVELSGLLVHFQEDRAPVSVEYLSHHNRDMPKLSVKMTGTPPKPISLTKFKPDVKEYKPPNYTIHRMPLTRPKDEEEYLKLSFGQLKYSNWDGKTVRIYDFEGVIESVSVFNSDKMTYFNSYCKDVAYDGIRKKFANLAKITGTFQHKLCLCGIEVNVKKPSDKGGLYPVSLEYLAKLNPRLEPLVVCVMDIEGRKSDFEEPKSLTLFDLS